MCYSVAASYYGLEQANSTGTKCGGIQMGCATKADRNVAMPKNNAPSLAGQFLKSYRKQYHLKQEQLAEALKVEPRTLRAWENGERQLNNINELYRIADLLGVDPEQLGSANSLIIPRTPEQIDEIIQHAWSLVEESRLREARAIIERLAQNVRTLITTEDPSLLRSLAPHLPQRGVHRF
jgi:transcriptional regulator with XRE-family HTH domain